MPGKALDLRGSGYGDNFNQGRIPSPGAASYVSGGRIPTGAVEIDGQTVTAYNDGRSARPYAYDI